MKEKIDILLATYQSGSYLTAQLDSILNQTHSNFQIFVRDDGSTDQTLSLIEAFKAKFPSKFTLISSHLNLGIKKNFSELLNQSSAPYIMFSDQDDVWLNDKIQLTLEVMHKAERQFGSATPLLVHTDLKVVDAKLQTINNSFWRYAHLNSQATKLNQVLTQNAITGCTMMINRALAQLTKPIPEEAVMHDWWIALTASALGQIICIPQQTILYRQHSRNDVGAKKYSLMEYFKRSPQASVKQALCVAQTHLQAKAFLERYEAQLNEEQKQILKAYATLEDLPFWQQKKQIMKFKFFKQGFLRNVKTLLS